MFATLEDVRKGIEDYARRYLSNDLIKDIEDEEVLSSLLALAEAEAEATVPFALQSNTEFMKSIVISYVFYFLLQRHGLPQANEQLEAILRRIETARATLRTSGSAGSAGAIQAYTSDPIFTDEAMELW